MVVNRVRHAVTCFAGELIFKARDFGLNTWFISQSAINCFVGKNKILLAVFPLFYSLSLSLALSLSLSLYIYIYRHIHKHTSKQMRRMPTGTFFGRRKIENKIKTKWNIWRKKILNICGHDLELAWFDLQTSWSIW